ncbi:imelysin family protein [Flavobacterium chuncheonense]|uniref:Imelysin family protein n=1 Tax=Flavobacterium chuncheonense TaxID=2026653 RepID=A0ABW5YP37_9FLAO
MKKLFLFLSVLGVFIACSSDSDSNTVGSGDNYDRTAMLTNWADNLIIPRYVDYQSKVEALNTAANDFATTPDQVNLESLRTAWEQAYKAYQYVGMFGIGKAEEINFVSCTNMYPTNVAGIETNITSGTYDFSLLSQYDKQGFPALDYMINGLATTDSTILAFYTTNVNATNYKQYLTDLTARLKINIDAIITDWNGNYRIAFIASNGNSVSSSVNKLVNAFVKYYERDVRAGKVGIPAGIYSNGTLYPEKVEAYYKNTFSKELLNEAIQSAQDFFNGKHFSSTAEGPSLKSYLDYLNTVRNGQNLSAIINTQFATIYTTNAVLSNSFSEQVNTDNNAMIASFDALQQNVVYFKLDMMQALNITVDYVDADGD